MVKEICLVFDTEADLYYYIPSPHVSKRGLLKWSINKILGKMYKYPWPSQNGLKNLVYFFKKNNVKANFCISGLLYNKHPIDNKTIEIIRPKNPWYFNKIGKDWYYFLKEQKKDSSIYLGEFIEKEMKSSLFELGFHGFAHEALTLEKKEKLDSIIGECVLAARKLGIKVNTFAAPFNMIEDINDPMKVFSILQKHGMKYVQYSGKDKGLINLHAKTKAEQIEKRGKVKLLRADIYFEATHSFPKMMEIFEKINNSREDKVLMVSHDFTWKNMHNLNMLIKFAKSKGIKFIHMSEYER